MGFLRKDEFDLDMLIHSHGSNQGATRERSASGINYESGIKNW